MDKNRVCKPVQYLAEAGWEYIGGGRWLHSEHAPKEPVTLSEAERIYREKQLETP